MFRSKSTLRRLSIENMEDRRLMIADLVPTIVDAPELGSVDQAIIVNTRVGNAGTSASGQYAVQYRLSLDGTIDTLDRVIFTDTRPSIEAGGSDVWTQEIPMPRSLPQGTYYVGVVVDPANQSAETEETNNVLVESNSIELLKGLHLSDCDTFGSAGTAYQSGVNCRTMSVGGYPRTFNVYIPSGVLESAENVPVVMMMHGSSGNGAQFVNISGWREKADEVGAIAIFPTGVMYCQVGTPCENGRLSGWTTKWGTYGFSQSPDFNFDRQPPGYPSDAPWPPDDVGFVGAMLDDVESLLPVDWRRIYSSGFSAGAGFNRRLVFDLSDRLAAVGLVGGGLGGNGDLPFAPADLIPVYNVIGSLDEPVLANLGFPLDGELPLDPHQILAIPELQTLTAGTLDVLQLNYDPKNLQPSHVQADAVSARLSWKDPLPGNRSGNSYHLSVWGGLIHHYPFRRSADKNPNGFVAVDTFWEFFARHQKPIPPGDVSLDGEVSFADFLVISSNFGNSNAEYTDGDLDGDGTVGFQDFLMLSVAIAENRRV